MERITMAMAPLVQEAVERSSAEETREACDARTIWPGSWMGRQRAGVLLLLTVCLVVRALSMPDETGTYDEKWHLAYGQQILKLNSNRLYFGSLAFVDDSKMPISVLNALPGMIASHFRPVKKIEEYMGALSAARVVTVLTSLLLGYLCFHWSRQVYGFGGGFFTLFLFAFEPNLIAHSQLVTTDLYVAATVTLALYASWRYSIAKDWRHAAVVGLAVGLSQLAKYSGVFLWILIPAILLLADSKRLVTLIRAKSVGVFRGALGKCLGHGCVVVLIAVLVINAGYLFNRTLTPLHEYNFQSDLFQSMQSALSPARFIRVPLPYPYLQGLDLVSFRERTGFGYGSRYLLGELSEEGFPGYYLIAFLFKVPLAIQLLCLLAASSFAAHWKSGHFRRAELFMLVPLLFFTVYYNFFFRAQMGIRFLLVIFPCILVFCGSLIARWVTFNRVRKFGIFVLSGYLIVSVLSYFPHYIPYFNELVRDRRLAYKVLADSNIDFGQNSGYLRQYVKQYPATHVNPEKPVAGRIVVEVNRLTGVIGDPKRYAWLRENFFPVATIAYKYLVYDISAEKVVAVSRHPRNQ